MDSICPSWFAFSLNNRLRRMVQDPDRILSPYIKPGSICADIGCGPGYFTIDMARLTSPEGRIIAIDMQPRMLEKMRKNSEQAGVSEHITAHQCKADDLMIPEKLDFALVFWMVHEVPKKQRAGFFRQLRAAMNKNGQVLVTDPEVPWMGSDFRYSVEAAVNEGFTVIDHPRVTMSRTALLRA